MNQQNLEAEATDYFHKLNKEYPLAVKAYQIIIATCNSFIASNDFQGISSLIKYIENGDGQYAFNYISPTDRFLKIFYIITLEDKYHLNPPFYNECSSSDDLINKYLLTLFALRRVLFHFSENDVVDSLTWLQNNSVSYIAIQIILQSERIKADKKLYAYLNILYPGVFYEQV